MPGAADPPREDPLARLEEQIARATDAAQRVFAEAAQVPPRGWQAPGAGGGQAPRPGPELEPLLAALEAARELIPPDLRRRLAEALREVLLALRALIDWYLERLERGDDGGGEVEEIPVL
ncbi:MAG TPA: hypothetical protein VE992_06125 [Solirubrobacteraceae bacterium]|nr:hypothetical protein [Solirubrobacteraceae bacterium]